MISYFISIIIIIICIEIYFRYYDINNKTTIISEPWDKIVVEKNRNKYYIKINNFNLTKYNDWKKNLIKIDYDIYNKYLIIKCKNEEYALAVANLFISNMNDKIELNYIIENDMINISYIEITNDKSSKYKLIELIKNGLEYNDTSDTYDTYDTRDTYDTYDTRLSEELSNIDEINHQTKQFENIQNDNMQNDNMQNDIQNNDIQNDDMQNNDIQNDDMQNDNMQNKVDDTILYNVPKPIENIIKPYSSITPYGGNEYASLSF
jgi:hypothetical protein